MKEQDKELLLKDLCARLPYGVKVQIKANLCYDSINTLNFDDLKSFIENSSRDEYWYDIVTSIKPYLRPMSSMTEEEKKTYNGFVFSTDEYGKVCESDDVDYLRDWLDANYFDHRRLIPKGLALEAPEGMYDFK